MSYCVNR